MAAGNWTFVNSGKLDIVDGTVDWNSDVMYMVLVLAAHTPSVSSDAAYSDISGDECGDGDYAAQDVGSATLAESGGTVTFDCANVTYGGAVTVTAKYAYILKGAEASPQAADEIVMYCDLNSGGGSVSSTAEDFSINMNASGLATLS